MNTQPLSRGLLLALSCLVWAWPARSQSIAPAADGTGTQVVTSSGSTGQYLIQGGSLSRDGANLFHSFERFGLTAGETANFLSNPQVQNILGRVQGGNASSINGLLQVTGSNANLYLVNPAGILFGPNARLDLPAAFTATTASGIGFGDRWFNAVGPNRYASLVGNPTGFTFPLSHPGVLVNSGNLAVGAGESLTLLGGTVINTGTLRAPGGTITVAAVPGGNWVRLSQTGNLLSLDLTAVGPAIAGVNPVPFTPLSLPALLTGGGGTSATGLTVNPDGSVQLFGSDLTLPTDPGTTLVSGNLIATAPDPTLSPEVNVLGDRVALLNANLNASGPLGGTIRVGGDYLGQGNVPNARYTFVDRTSTLRANGLFSSSPFASGGRIIVWADNATRFYGSLAARGGGTGGNGGFAEVSGQEFLDFRGMADLTAVNGQAGTLLLDPLNITVVAGPANPPDLPSGGGSQLLFADNPGGNSTVNNGTLNAALANVLLQATNNITFDAPVNIAAAGVGLTAQANNDIFVNAGITTNNGAVALTANADAVGFGRVSVAQPIATRGGAITLQGSSNLNETPGIFIASTGSLNSGGGILTLTGNATGTGDFARGIDIQGEVNSQGGAIAITGTSAAAEGIVNFVPINSGGGNITLTGTSTGTGTFARGVALVGPVTSQEGAIAITGTGANSGIATFSAINGVGSINSGTGDITLTTDRSLLQTAITGTGNLVIQPLTPGLNLTLGGVGDIFDTFLNDSELALLTNGFTSIALGRADGSGAITLGGNLTFNDPVTLRSPLGTGTINTNGFSLTGADNATLTLLANGNITTGAIENPNRAITLTSTGGRIATSNLSTQTGVGGGQGTVSLTAFNGIQTGNINTFVNGGSGGNITLQLTGTGGEISTGGLTSLTFQSNFTGNGTGGDININANGGGITTGNIDSYANLSGNSLISRGGNITLNGSNIRTGDLNNNGLGGLGPADASGGAIALNATGTLTVGNINNKDSPITLSGNLLLNRDIILQIVGAGNNVTVNGTVNGNQSLIVNAGPGNITFNGAIGDTTVLNNMVANSSGITRFNGPVTVGSLITDAGGTTQLLGNVTATASGQQYGDAVQVTGDLSLTGNELNFAGTVAGTGNLTLQPFSPEQAIALGGTTDNGTSQLDLLAAELTALQNGFASLTIGRADGGGAITLGGAVTFSDPVTLRSPTGNGTINTTGGILSGADNASLTLLANQDITTGTLANPGRAIALTSFQGGVNTTGGSLDTRSATVGGPVALSANTGITTDALLLGTTLPGGTSGALSLSTPGFLNLGNLSLNGAPLVIQNARSFFLAGDLDTSGSPLALSLSGDFTLTGNLLTQGGAFTVDSGGVVQLGGNLRTGGGSVSLTGSSITIPAGIDTTGSAGGGAIALNARSGNLVTGNLFGGNMIAALAEGSIVTGDITTGLSGGAIALDAGTHLLTGNLNSSNSFGFGGPINAAARRGNLTTGTLNSSGLVGGSITVAAENTISTGSLDASGSSGSGGAIALTAREGSITTGDVNSSGLGGGDVSYNASTAITAGTINTSGQVGAAGNVTLDPSGDIAIGSINAQGGRNGRGGNVEIVTGRFFRANQSFTALNNLSSSISTIGGTGGGSVTIRHGGALSATPFVVGNAATNGTTGAITTGTTSLEPTRAFFFSTLQGNVSIINGLTEVEVPDEETLEDPGDIAFGDEAKRAEAPNIETVAMALDSSESFNDTDFKSTETGVSNEFADYFGFEEEVEVPSVAAAADTLSRIQAAVELAQPALLYVLFVPAATDAEQSSVQQPSNQGDRRDDDQLELVLITASGEPVRRRIPNVTRADVQRVSRTFLNEVTDVRKTQTTSYLAPARQLYEWLIAPIETELQQRRINNIAFVLGSGLRTLPIAALHDGQQFLVERYSLGLMPSLNLTDTRYRDIRQSQVLAMGASEFTDQPPLPAVPLEIQEITQELWTGRSFLNQDFTPANLIALREQQPFGIVHLATHGEFRPGNPGNSYIQFWNQRLTLEQIRQLRLNDPPVSLLVLSACRTAVGDAQAELGFAGFALQAGVQSVLASLWYVSDEGTLALMTEFYRQLREVPLKAEALRRAQLALIRGDVELQGASLLNRGTPTLTLSDRAASNRKVKLNHPYYWASFTLIGSPW